MRSVSIEIGDHEYEIEVKSFHLPTESRGWEPGDGGEIELADPVTIWDQTEQKSFVSGVISMRNFLNIYADNEGLKLDRAEEKLQEYCLESIAEQLSDEYDDVERDDG